MSFKMVLVIAFGLLFLYGLFTVGFPFLLALIIALFLEPLVQLVMKIKGVNRLISATIVCILFTVGLFGVLYLIGLKIFSEILVLVRKLPDYVAELDVFVQDTILRAQVLYERLPDEMVVQIQNAAGSVMNTLVNALTSLSRSLLNFAGVIPDLFVFCIVFIVALFLTSYSLTTFKDAFLSLFEESSQLKVSEVLLNLRDSIFGFFRAQVILSGLTYLVALIGLFILDVNYAMAIALLIIIVDILPILGTGSVLVPWAVYAMITGNMFLGIGLIVLFLFITAFRRTIEPKILGHSIGIGALSTLISLYVGFKLVGVIGLFLGPIVVILYTAMRRVGLLNIKIKLE